MVDTKFGGTIILWKSFFESIIHWLKEEMDKTNDYVIMKLSVHRLQIKIMYTNS